MGESTQDYRGLTHGAGTNWWGGPYQGVTQGITVSCPPGMTREEMVKQLRQMAQDYEDQLSRERGNPVPTLGGGAK